MNMRISFDAPSRVKKVLAQLGRTEDIKFSPNNRRLAICGFTKNKLLVLDVEIAVSAAGVKIGLTDFMELTSTSLREPHGLFFLDDDTLIVANRSGSAPVLKLPPSGSHGKKLAPSILRTLRGGVFTPGSVTVSRTNGGHYDVLICNNFVNYVSRHVLEDMPPFEVISNEVLLCKGLEIPDGVAVSHDGNWIAVSNHSKREVFLYENTPQLNMQSEPDGILNNIGYPHGLRFTQDDRFLLVADAGAPYVHLYVRGAESWKGVRSPCALLRVMDDEVFVRGHENLEEGGPKGIDIDNTMSVLVTTCEQQILTFFDLQAILKNSRASGLSQPSSMAGRSAS